MMRKHMPYSPGYCVAVALLAACGAPQQPSSARGATLEGAVLATPSHRGKSWMDAGAERSDLLYVGNRGGGINVYRYWQRKLVGRLNGFDGPTGECTDARGDVYITDYGNKRIVEYAHAGTEPLRVIDDSPYVPNQCAIDLASGTLAVANIAQGSDYGSGNVAVYRHGRGKPTYFTSETLYHINSVAYDLQGNLFAAGFYNTTGSQRDTYFAYLPHKSSDFEQIDVPPYGASGWGFVRGVGWDGKYWTVVSFGELYQYTVAGSGAELAGKLTLDGGGYSGPVAFYSTEPLNQATQAVGGYYDGTNDVYYWKYPAGGEPYFTISLGLEQPFGVAISLARK